MATPYSGAPTAEPVNRRPAHTVTVAGFEPPPKTRCVRMTTYASPSP